MTRTDNLDALPFADYADADPNRLPLGERERDERIAASIRAQARAYWRDHCRFRLAMRRYGSNKPDGCPVHGEDCGP